MGYDPTLDTVVVSHQGTDPEEMYVAVLIQRSHCKLTCLSVYLC